MLNSELTRCSLLFVAVVAAGVYLAIAVSGLVFGAPGAYAANEAPSGTFGEISFAGNDSVYNWDFRTSGGAVSNNVDWGMRFIFADDADVEYVRDRLDGDGNDPSITPELGGVGSNMKARLKDGSYWLWNFDGGMKNYPGCVLNYGHMRIYARSNDSMWNNDLGYYVVATLHRDKETVKPWGCSKLYVGYESSENWWVSRIQSSDLTESPYNWTIDSTELNWENAADYTDISAPGSDVPHWYQSDGYGPIVRVSGDD